MNLLNKNNFKILICTHKETDLPKDDFFLPVHVGAANSGKHWIIQRDDELANSKCDNISEKNPFYCELTAMYWAWKNLGTLYPNIKYIGLNHYRRYFNFKAFQTSKDVYIKEEKEVSNYRLNIKYIEKQLKNNRIIVSKLRFYPYSLFTDYAICHYSEDFRILMKSIESKFPEYKKDATIIFEQNNSCFNYNMFIMSYKDFCEYSSWLFELLFDIEKNTNIENYSAMQKRIYGFMAERLMNLWIFHNHKNVKHVPVNFYTNTQKFDSYKTFKKNNFAYQCSLPLKLQIRNIIIKNRCLRLLFNR